MSRGVRFINGKEFLLSGRFDTKEAANNEADLLRKEWKIVKVLKINHIHGCYSCWVHGAR